MKSIALVLCSVLVVASAYAVIDPDPDGVGIYFDLIADTNYVLVNQFDQVTVYLIITNPWADCIGGWECSLEFDMVACPVVGEWIYSGSALNIFEPPDFAVGLATPLAAQAATLILAFTVLVVDPAGTDFVVGPSPMPSNPENLPMYVYGCESSFGILYNSTGYGPGGEILPSASINGDVWVGAQRTTWSAVKSIW